MSIAQTANVLIFGADLIQKILRTTLKHMDAAEAETLSGENKKAWVIAFIKSFITDEGEKWEDWVKTIVTFIDYAKAFYNQFK